MKDKTAGLLILLFILFAFEGLSRLFYAENYLEKIKAVLREDAELMWTQKPGLDTFFEGVSLRTNSLGFRGPEMGEKKEKRVVVMGASPAFGWGVEEARNYSSLLAGRLAKAGVNAEVVNASVIGYSSWQGRKLLEKEILRLKPDIVVFAYGVNDVDKYRFFRNFPRPDSLLPSKSGFSAALSNFLFSSRFVRLYSRLLEKAAASFRSGCPADPPARVSPEEFAENAKFFYESSVKNGFRLVLATSPFHKPSEYYRVSCGKGEDDKCPRSLRCRASSAGGEKEKLLSRAAEAELYQAYDAMQVYNETLRKYAAGEKAVILLDAEREFKKPGAGEKYFLKPETDFVHFSEKGHEAFSELLSGTLKKL